MEPITRHTPGPVELELEIPAGRVEIETAERDDTVLDITGEGDRNDVLVEMHGLPGGAISIAIRHRHRTSWTRRGNLRVHVATKPSVNVRCQTGSADMVVRGAVGSLSARTGSGDLLLGDVTGDLDLNVASGDARAGAVGGSVSADSASGDVQIASVGGDLSAKLASGDLRVGAVEGSSRVTSASGDIEIGAVARGAVALSSMSGDVAVGVRKGTAVWLDLSSVSGDASFDLDSLTDDPPNESGPVLELRASSVSGDVRVTRAAASVAR